MSVAGYVIAVAATAPDLSELKPADKGANSVIFAADGSRLGYVQSDEIRTPVPWRDMPRGPARRGRSRSRTSASTSTRASTTAAIVRAGVKNLESGKNVQGGSTITQQLVRALYIKDPKRNFQRKIREAKLASELEEEHSKHWILKNYLNDVPFGTVDGRTAIGVEAAAETFFNKHAKDLTLPEAALLAGLPQAPSQYNPFRNPTAALERRNEVLEKMVENRLHHRGRGRGGDSAPLGLKRGTRYTRRREPYFFDYVQEKLIEEYGVGVYRRGGLKVYTTINPKLQDARAQGDQRVLRGSGGPRLGDRLGRPGERRHQGDGLERHLQGPPLQPRRPGPPPAGLGVQDDGAHDGDPQGHRPELAPPTRPSRSNLNVPGYGPWKVKTYGNTYGGSMNLVRATLASDNTVYAQLIIDVGPKKVCETAKLLGHPDQARLPARRGPRRPAARRHARSRWRTPTPRSPRAGSATAPTAIQKVVFPDGKSESFEPRRASAC